MVQLPKFLPTPFSTTLLPIRETTLLTFLSAINVALLQSPDRLLLRINQKPGSIPLATAVFLSLCLSTTHHFLTLTTPNIPGTSVMAQPVIRKILEPKSILSGDTVGCSYDLSTFYNTSTGSNDFLWLWGDYNLNTRSDTGMLKHMYETPANFNVLLIATNTSGCKDTASLKIRIKAGAKANFTFNHPYACAPARFKITNTTAYGKDYKWYANNQLVSTGPSIPDSLIITDTTRIRIKLFVTSLSTCRPDSIEKVYFTPKNPTAVVSNRDSGCGPLTVVFNNASTHTYRSLWNFGNGSTSNLKNPTVIFSPALSNDSNYSVKLNVQNWLGCADSTNTTIKVFPKPSAIFSLSDTAGCGPKFIRFTNTSKTNNSNTFNSLIHRWNFGDGSSDTAAFPTHTFKPNNSKDTVYHIQLDR